MESPFQGLQYCVLGYWQSLCVQSTTAVNTGANCSLFVGTSIFQKAPYEALALPSFTVERPSTIDHQPHFLLVYTTTSNCRILCCLYLSITVVWCQPVAQIIDNGLVYQRQRGGCNHISAMPSKWPRSNAILFDNDCSLFAIYITIGQPQGHPIMIYRKSCFWTSTARNIWFYRLKMILSSFQE